MAHIWEYGGRGTFAIAVPQANPVVEPEIQALVPDGVNVIATRLSGSRTDSRDRLVGYFETLEGSLAAFDSAEIDVAGYACTGSTYILGRETEDAGLDKLSRALGYPIVSSSQAITEALAALGAQRVALVAPYPQWLAELSVRFWQEQGFSVCDYVAAPIDPNDTRSAYRFRSHDIAPLVERLQRNRAEVLLLSGTGMPTLRALDGLTTRFGLPVLSSNLCLAWAAMRRLGLADNLPPPLGAAPSNGDWLQRLRA
jgi:maleate isomerase